MIAKQICKVCKEKHFFLFYLHIPPEILELNWIFFSFLHLNKIPVKDHF